MLAKLIQPIFAGFRRRATHDVTCFCAACVTAAHAEDGVGPDELETTSRWHKLAHALHLNTKSFQETVLDTERVQVLVKCSVCGLFHYSFIK